LRVVNADGSERGKYPLGSGERAWPIRELVPGKVGTGVTNGNVWSAVIVDLATGTVTRSTGARPLFDNGFGPLDLGVGLAGPVMLLLDGHSLVRWNVLTNEKRTLIAG